MQIDYRRRWAGVRRALREAGADAFVAVGAGHLAGSGSVQDQLKALGLQVDRVKK